MQYYSMPSENMKSFIVLLLIAICACEKRDTSVQQGHQTLVHQNTCIDDRFVVQAYRYAYDNFAVKLYQKVASRGRNFLTMCPLAVWITLAAMAEGADSSSQRELFAFLNLPDDLCTRQKFYHVATTRLSSSNYVSVFHTWALVIDEGAQINPNWYNLVRENSLLQVIPAPIKYNPATTSEIIKHIISPQTLIPKLNGNSVILNSVDYNGLWTTAFAGAIVTRSPFYDRVGHKIGSVDLMRVKRRVRIGYAASINTKVIELPIGVNKEYRMIFALVVDADASVKPAVMGLNNNTVLEILGSLQESYTQIDVAIPRFVINSEIDMKEILQELGVWSLWNDPSATRYISSPPAKPSGYIQRATLTLSNEGLNPPPYEYPSYHPASAEEQYWREFVADRPFMFGLFDADTYTCLMATLYTQPTYPY